MLKKYIVRYVIPANYIVYMLFDEIIWEIIGYYLIAGDYGKLTHCMIIIIVDTWKFLGHALVVYISVNHNPWLILVSTFALALWAALQAPMKVVSETQLSVASTSVFVMLCFL